MKTPIKSPLVVAAETATAEQVSAQAYEAEWTKKRVAMADMAHALEGALASVRGQLRKARAAALATGDDPADMAKMGGQERDLIAQIEETVARGAIAAEYEAAAHAKVVEAAARATSAQLAAMREARGIRAGELDREIDGALARLVEVLNQRAELVYGPEPVAFNWHAIPSASLRCRLALPGS